VFSHSSFFFRILGWSALSGVVVVLLAYVVNYPLAKYNIYVTRNSWKTKDSRMEKVNELLQNIRFLKFFGWGNLDSLALSGCALIPA
jgi:hypothetical protein